MCAVVSAERTSREKRLANMAYAANETWRRRRRLLVTGRGIALTCTISRLSAVHRLLRGRIARRLSADGGRRWNGSSGRRGVSHHRAAHNRLETVACAASAEKKKEEQALLCLTHASPVVVTPDGEKHGGKKCGVARCWRHR